mmetsp:Transcript_5659/g.14445  ORF Transcript_5659/g.14445 Transcript_5659/m.14445 type:complete len:362 (-) Transcript_5659:150-1235(-)
MAENQSIPNPPKKRRVALTSERTTVGILGGGAWGTALAIHCARMGHTARLWCLEQEVAESINSEHENKLYLPGVKCPEGLTASTDKHEVVKQSKLLLMVIPTPFVASTMKDLADVLRPEDQMLVSCTKGILNDTLETVNEILERVLPPAFHSRLSYLSGPSFAAEVATGQPTAVTIAAKDEEVGIFVQSMLSTPKFRCYRTTDVVGVELGGSLKNVLAIACGMSDGVGFGNNIRAALITRGNNEIVRLALEKGANPHTMSGLAGVGDLVLTCTGEQSRNRTVGLRLGQGETLEQVMSSMKAVAEGVLTSRSANALAEKLGVDCPIINGIYRVIHGGEDPKKVTEEVMSRDLRFEVDDELVN